MDFQRRSLDETQPLLPGPVTAPRNSSAVLDPPQQKEGRRKKLRRKVREIINARSFLSDKRGNLRVPGAPPGVDVNVPQPTLSALFKNDVDIRVTDYSATKLQVHRLDPYTLGDFLHQPRPNWVKVRWVDVSSINYPVIEQLGKHYKLHPLAVEDVFHFPQAVKADWYENHLYISIVLTTLEAGLSSGSDREEGDGVRPVPLFKGRPKSIVFGDQPSRPNVLIEQINFFLLRDGTLLSIFQQESENIVTPIYNRLEEHGTIIRDSEDASFLMFSLMDMVADHFFPIVEAYKTELDGLESYVLNAPKAEATRELHVIAKELGILRRTLVPTKNLVTALRENGNKYYSSQDNSPTAPFISKLTRVYLGDIKDHVNMVVDDLERYEVDARSLIDLIFNTIAHSTNEAMKTLALVTVVFLPISFLAGVFGMNFEYFPELHWKIGVYGFWIIVVAMVAVLLVLFRWIGWISR